MYILYVYTQSIRVNNVQMMYYMLRHQTVLSSSEMETPQIFFRQCFVYATNVVVYNEIFTLTCTSSGHSINTNTPM